MTASVTYQSLCNGLGEMVISQPNKRNALNAKMWADIPVVLTAAAQDSSLRVLIVRGEGDHFASGADISEFETLYATEKTSANISKAIAAGMNALAEFPMPTIAMVRGACVGGGCGLSLCCDLRFADTSSKFAITPAKLGLVYPYGDVQRLIETVGLPAAKDLLFSARLILIDEAKSMGLVNQSFAPEDLDAAVKDYASGIARLSSQSAKTTKKMFAAYQSGQRVDTPESEAWFLSGFSSDDFKEGYRAFLDKRKPEF